MDPGFEATAKKAIEVTLRQIPFVRILGWKEAPPREVGIRPDFTVDVEVGSVQKTLIIELTSSGQPRHARAVVNNVIRLRPTIPNAYPILVAPFISPKSAKICEEASVGYIDLAGNCSIVFDHVYVHHTGNPNPFVDKRALRSLYSPKAERVLRVLLDQGQTRWKVQQLAKKAGVSIGHASNVKNLLADREWMREDPEGWVLAEPEELLNEWRENFNPKRSRWHMFYSPMPVSEIEAQLEKELRTRRIKYGFTEFSGASRWAPVVTYKKVTAYLAELREDLISAASLKKVPTGGNVELILPYDEGVFYCPHLRGDITVVSPIQNYLDLVHNRGRGEEAAESLLEYIRTYVWRRRDSVDEI